MAGEFWLSDGQWARLQPLLPNKPRGVPRVDDRRVISGIVHVLQSGCRWKDAPAIYGPPKTLYNRNVRWAAKGVWREVFEALAAAGGKGGRTPRRSASAEADATPRSTPSPMARADASPSATTSSPPISSATSTSPPPSCGGNESWPEAANLTTTSSEPSCVVPHSTENCSGRRARTRSGLIGNRS